MNYNKSDYEPYYTNFHTKNGVIKNKHLHVANCTDAYRNGHLKTEKMWRKLGYKLSDIAVGIDMYTNCFCQHISTYYFIDEVEGVKRNGVL